MNEIQKVEVRGYSITLLLCIWILLMLVNYNLVQIYNETKQIRNTIEADYYKKYQSAERKDSNVSAIPQKK